MQFRYEMYFWLITILFSKQFKKMCDVLEELVIHKLKKILLAVTISPQREKNFRAKINSKF